MVAGINFVQIVSARCYRLSAPQVNTSEYTMKNGVWQMIAAAGFVATSERALGLERL
jgi:hypothetical protein